jgi:hypothetical protein
MIGAANGDQLPPGALLKFLDGVFLRARHEIILT